jgi:hypothetical protein
MKVRIPEILGIDSRFNATIGVDPSKLAALFEGREYVDLELRLLSIVPAYMFVIVRIIDTSTTSYSLALLLHNLAFPGHAYVIINKLKATTVLIRREEVIFVC